MAQYSEISEDNQTIFDNVLETTTIPKWVVFKLLGKSSQKDLYVTKKVTDLYKSLTDVDVVIVLNEEIFDQLPEDMKKIALEEALAAVIVDTNTDKLMIEKFNFTTFTGLLAKYGHEEMIKFKESIKSLFDKMAQEENDLKLAKRAKKLKKE
jgi:nitrogen regulatory protein PII